MYFFYFLFPENPILDAWYGARKFSLSPLLTTSSITRAEYEEKGGEYLKEHRTSNRYFPTPASNKWIRKINPLYHNFVLLLKMISKHISINNQKWFWSGRNDKYFNVHTHRICWGFNVRICQGFNTAIISSASIMYMYQVYLHRCRKKQWK